MTCSQYLHSIHDLVDGTIGSIRRAELELHLEQCEDCRGLLRDLERIRDAAAALPPLAPPDGAWLQIAGRLRQEGRIQDVAPIAGTHRVRTAWLAAAAALVITVGGSAYVLLTRAPRAAAPVATTATSTATAPAAGNSAAPHTVESVLNEVDAAQAQLDKAIANLEAVKRANQQALDQKTAATIDKNLAITDQAIAESRAAVKAEPTSVAARETLFDALRQKVSLLEDTISLINEMRKGNNAAAVEVLNKSS